MQDFTNGELDIDLLPKYEEVSLKALSPKYWNVVILNLSIFLFFLAAVGVTFFLITEEVESYIYLAAGLYLAFAVLLFLLYRADIRRRGFAIRENDLIYRSGIIAISTSVIPFIRIQHIALHEGIFSRIYGLGALHIYTAGGSSGSIKISGIEIEEARSIREILMKQLVTVD